MLKALLPQTIAFVHGHRGSWHNPDVATDLRQLFWGQVEDYLPLSRKYFESFGPWFWSYPSKPERHLQKPIATGEAATNGSFLKHEVRHHLRHHLLDLNAKYVLRRSDQAWRILCSQKQLCQQ